MNYDVYGEIINGEKTYKEIAKNILFDNFNENSRSVIIGWTDQKCDHRDIMFTYCPKKYGNLQRGLRWCYLYISIMDFCSMGFLIERNTDNRKHEKYIKEKLQLGDNHCDDKICELINGVIHELDMLEGNYKDEN